MRILLVEDEEKLNQTLCYRLRAEGYQVDGCGNGEEALYYIGECAYDVIILDWMLPGVDGLSVLRQIRKQGINTPVLMLTALGTLQNKLEGLTQGADDYMVKPFATEELIARIQCLHRRPRQLQTAHVLSLGDLTLETDHNLLTGKGGSCELSKKETLLLEALINNRDQVLPRSILISKVWGPDSNIEDGNLDNYIHFLRRRLTLVGSQVTLKTVRGVGYFLEES